ncbi:MAG: hypothetical protein JWP97_839, partial [Labilithrix sp.]|nr:hypothetical protein [Labilithrix sp.]
MGKNPRGPRASSAYARRLMAGRKGRALAGFVAFLSFFAFVASARTARADLQVDARWKQGALREEWTVQQWLPDGCGPTPTSSTTGGGEPVTVRLEGDELAIVGGGKVYRSNTCYDPMPTLQRETHSRDAGGKTWRTRCSTPANDARKAILNTLVIVQNDAHIDLVETGRYEVVLGTGRCVADVKRTRAYDVVTEAPAASAAPPPQPAAEPKPAPEPKPGACDVVGAPARLEVRPSRKLLRAGETFQLRASVLDAKGCGTRTPTTWKVGPGAPPGLTVDAAGKVTAAKDVAEGSFEIVVTAAEKETRVAVEIATAARYDDLLASSGLNAAGESEAASVVSIGSTSIGAGEGTVEDHAKQRRLVFIGIIAVVLVALAALATLLRSRSKKAAAATRAALERHEMDLDAHARRRQEREAAHAAQKRAHEESLRAAAEAKERARAAALA